MEQTIFDKINKLQQHVDVIDASIAAKEYYILNGSSDEELKCMVREDIRGLKQERNECIEEIMKLKIQFNINQFNSKNNE